jgi:hypothetical protein
MWFQLSNNMRIKSLTRNFIRRKGTLYSMLWTYNFVIGLNMHKQCNRTPGTIHKCDTHKEHTSALGYNYCTQLHCRPGQTKPLQHPRRPGSYSNITLQTAHCSTSGWVVTLCVQLYRTLLKTRETWYWLIILTLHMFRNCYMHIKQSWFEITLSQIDT